MISVPEVDVTPLEEVPELLGQPDEVVAAVLMHMMGDLTGRTLLLFPEPSARDALRHPAPSRPPARPPSSA